jgi:protein TonB
MALIPPRLGRPLMAIWISLGLHAALFAFVRVVPPGATAGASAIEARLVQRVSVVPVAEPDVAPVAAQEDATLPAQRVPVETADALPTSHAPDAAAAAPPVTAPAQPAVAPETPALAISSGADLNFYPARELDVPPRALRAILPEYPPEADRQRLSGRVRLEIRLEADGRVSDVEIVDADRPGTFDDSALKAFRAARFAPAQKDGRPVRARLLIEVVYDWEGSGGR